MSRKLTAIFLVSIFCEFANASPFHSQHTEAYDSTIAPKKDASRLRLALGLNGGPSLSNVHVGAITACSDQACYGISRDRLLNIPTSEQGQAIQLADAWIPHDTIRSIHFDTVVGQRVVRGALQLKDPLRLDGEFAGGIVYIVLNRHTETEAEVLSPAESDAGPFGVEGTEVFYDPKYTSKVKLPLGASISIPANATTGPRVFNISVSYDGHRYPSIDIFPTIHLLAPATVHVLSAPSKSTAVGAVARAPLPFGLNPSSWGEIDSNEVDSIITDTGLVKPGRRPISTNRLIAPAALEASTCAAQLAEPQNKAEIKELLKKSGAMQIEWCQDIPPYIHIAIINLSDARQHYSIPAVQSPGGEDLSKLTLMPIEHWAAGYNFTLNGFTWSGDEGTEDNQHGFADGYLYSAGKCSEAIDREGAPMGRTGSVPAINS